MEQKFCVDSTLLVENLKKKYEVPVSGIDVLVIDKSSTEYGNATNVVIALSDLNLKTNVCSMKSNIFANLNGG